MPKNKAVNKDEQNPFDQEQIGRIEAFAAIREIHRQSAKPIPDDLPEEPNHNPAKASKMRQEALLMLLAAGGLSFTKGRKTGTVGPIRKAIRNFLKRNPAAKNDDLWKTISASPPKGWGAMDNRIGKYFEGPTSGDNMSYERFCNIAAEERKILNM